MCSRRGESGFKFSHKWKPTGSQKFSNFRSGKPTKTKNPCKSLPGLWGCGKLWRVLPCYHQPLGPTCLQLVMHLMASVLEMSGVIWGCWQKVTCPSGKSRILFQAVSHCSSCTFVERWRFHFPWLETAATNHWRNENDMVLRGATSYLPRWAQARSVSFMNQAWARERCLFTQAWFIKSEPGSFPQISALQRSALGRCNCWC